MLLSMFTVLLEQLDTTELSAIHHACRDAEQTDL